MLANTIRLQRRKTKTKIPGSLLVWLAYLVPVAAMFGLAVLGGGIYKLFDPEFDLKVLFAFATAPCVIGGLLLGWGVHSKLYTEGFCED